MHTPVLSVVIPAFNVADFIRPAIDSVLSQSFSDLEVIVVEDGSTDSTASRVMEVRDPRVRMISKPNGGLAAARNTGIRAAKGKYIALLDGDDVWFQDYAAHHVNALDRDPALGISYNFLAFLNEQGEPTGQLLTPSRKPTVKNLIIRNSITGIVILRRECFQHAGLFDETLRACEDHDMWVRILYRTRYKARVLPEVLAGYRIRSTSLTMAFEHQIKHAHALADKFEREIGISRIMKRRSLAEDYRITSTKALFSGHPHEAARFLRSALRNCPWLPLCDMRALGCLLLVAIACSLPAHGRRVCYRAAMGAIRLFYRRSRIADYRLLS